jgi:hypothetical protein
MGGQCPSKHREGKVGRDKQGSRGLGREHVSNSMSAVSDGDGRGNLTS